MSEPTASALKISELRVSRGDRPVLKGVSIDIPPGEITTLLGPNGAGKSTLVLAIGGMLKATGGTVQIGDANITGAKPDKIRAAGVAVVPEGRRLLPNLSVEDNLRVATYNLSNADADTGIAYALELFPELERRFDTIARSLSGGEQQMVVLAQALASKPRVMIVDELSLGLAPVVVKRLMPVIERVADEGAGVLLIEQFAHVALALATTAYVIEGGEIRYSGTAAELRDNPDMLHGAYLLGARP
jgi:branched-chain amino acid transport system ATP-binding protein